MKSHLTQSKCAVQIAQFFNLDNVCNVVVDRLNWITIGSTMFKVKDSFILCSFNNNSRQFGLIVDILLLREHYFFICKIFRTVKFYNHLQAFRLRERNDDFHIAVSYSTLPDFHVYCKHKPAFHRPKSLDVFITCKIELSLSDDWYVYRKNKHQLQQKLRKLYFLTILFLNSTLISCPTSATTFWWYC